MRVFQSPYAKHLKINYKNGKSFNVRNAIMITVFQKRRNGGHDIEYTTNVGHYPQDEPTINCEALKQFYVGSQDIVSIELKGTKIGGVELGYAKKVFIR